MAAVVAPPKQVLAELEKGKGRALYYLYGEEPFKINEFVEKATRALFGDEKNLTFCIDRIDGAAATGADVLDAIQSMGLFGGEHGGSRRLVVVRQAHLLKEVEALANAAPGAGKTSPWGENLLLLVGDSLDGRRKFHQWLKKEGLALEFKPARDAELAQWVQYLAKKTGATVSGQAAQMLAVFSDGSLYRLSQEIEKAWLFAGAKPGVELTIEHVAAISSSQVTHEMVELVSAILEGKRTRALLLAEKLIRASEDALGLVGFLTWAIKNPGKGFTGSLAGGTARARRMIRALVELDVRLKTSSLDVSATVEQFVIEQTFRPTALSA